MKQEYLSHYIVRSLDKAAQHLEWAVFLYNYKRPYLSCAMQSPNEAHRSWGPLERHWKNYYKPLVTEPPEWSTFRTTSELVNSGSDYRQTVSLFPDETARPGCS